MFSVKMAVDQFNIENNYVKINFLRKLKRWRLKTERARQFAEKLSASAEPSAQLSVRAYLALQPAQQLTQLLSKPLEILLQMQKNHQGDKMSIFFTHLTKIML